MKRNNNILVVVFVFLFFSTTIIKASTLQSDDYISLHPLDTNKLPEIIEKHPKNNTLKRMLNKPSMWKHIKHYLNRNHFSDKSIGKLFKLLERNTKKQIVKIRCTYPTSINGNDTLWVSGKIILPINRTLKGIILANHYTITSNQEAPSNTTNFEEVFALKGYAILMPDYIGYGTTASLAHPYLHWQSSAQTTIDLLLHATQLLDYYEYQYQNNLIIFGYSQGAAVALGVTKLLEQNSLPYTIDQLYAGAGPYDVAGTYDYSIQVDSIGIPTAIPMIVMGMSEAYGLGLKKQDFLQEPLLSNFDNWITSKTYTLNEIQSFFSSNRLSDLMTPQGLDKTCPETAKLYKAMLNSSLIDYVPKCPAYFFHSIEDDMVPIINTRHLQQHIHSITDTTTIHEQSKIEFYPPSAGSHMSACIDFVSQVYIKL